jgi:hypothetical protein
VATDYGGTHGGQPWHGAQPQYSGQPPYGPPYGGPPHGGSPHEGPQHTGPPYAGPPYARPPYGEPPHGGPPPPDRAQLAQRRTRKLAIAVLVLGGLGLVGFGTGALVQSMPRKFTAEQRQQITDWQFGKRWRDLTAGAIFPASVSYPAPAALSDDPLLRLSAERVGVAKQATCASATDPGAAAVLDRDGCAAILRATYVDGTDSYVVTVGAAVLPGTAKALSAARAIAGANGVRSAVHAVPVTGTPAAAFTDKRRQLSGVVSAGTYVVLYTVGYADTRPKEPVTGDRYADAEMTSAGVGVAHEVLSVLAAPVPPPSCPGAPGC